MPASEHLRFGVTWRPEHEEREQWQEDLRLMTELGLSCLSWGAGSWPRLQPDPDGAFVWDEVDAVLEACADAGILVVLVLPTTTPPAWFDAAHPDAILRDDGGRELRVRGRIAYDYTSHDYRRACISLVEALTERYAGDERILAWQIDDGFGRLADDGVRIPSRRESFAEWLRRRYGDEGQLQAAWGLHGSAAEGREFAAIGLPTEDPEANRHHWVDYHHFLADVSAGFVTTLASILRQGDRDKQIIFGEREECTNPTDLWEAVEVLAQFHTPVTVAEAERPAQGLDYGRLRISGKPIWALEQPVSEIPLAGLRAPVASPGRIAVVAMQSIGHGADLVSWSRWRSGDHGLARHAGGVLPSWGETGRFYTEIRELIQALAPHVGVIAATRPLAHVARLVGFDQAMAHQVEPWVREQIGPLDIGRGCLCELGLNEDQLAPLELVKESSYLVALLPHAVGITAADIAALKQWVEDGGTLIVGPLAGHRDEHLADPDQAPPPGALAELTGTRNDEATTWLQPLMVNPINGGRQLVGGHYGEIVSAAAEGVDEVARFATGWLAGLPAACQRQLGKGRVIHCGVALNDEILGWLWMDLALPRPRPVIMTHDPCAEVLIRVNGDYALHFAVNHGDAPAVCYLHGVVDDLLTGDQLHNSFTLPAKGWRILREQTRP